MEILTKSSLDYLELLDRKNKGASNIEIHLEDETIKNLYKNIGDHLNAIRDLNLEIFVIHAPISCGYDIEDIFVNYKKIEDVFFLADEIGKMQKKEIIVILHMDYDLEVFKRLNVINRIVEKLNQLLDTYGNTTVAIEGLMIISDDKGKLNIGTNYKDEPVELAEYFNERSKHKIGTVLDTCHMLSNIQLLENYRGISDDKKIPNIEYYIEKYIKTLKVVHLSYEKNYGYKPESHALPFVTDEEIEVLNRIVKGLKISGYSGIITIEVNEDDYNDSKNWLVTKNNLTELLIWNNYIPNCIS